jgi:polyhydroxyalkanoate synthesis repressor PhaR
MRTIKRYSNRKLYDSSAKHYVTLRNLAECIRTGETIVVIEKDTNLDLTTATLAQIIFEEEKLTPKMSAERLHAIIREGLA